MSIQARNHVQTAGQGQATMVFAHGFGCDQHMWRLMAPHFQGRFKTALIDSANYFMLCSRYLERAPVRQQLASQPEDYPWSSYAHHAGIRQEPLIMDHALYWGLGNTPFQREAAYIALSAPALGSDDLAAIDAAVLKGWPLGSASFKSALQQRAKRQVLPAKRGRPFKTSPPSA